MAGKLYQAPDSPHVKCREQGYRIEPHDKIPHLYKMGICLLNGAALAFDDSVHKAENPVDAYVARQREICDLGRMKSPDASFENAHRLGMHTLYNQHVEAGTCTYLCAETMVDLSKENDVLADCTQRKLRFAPSDDIVVSPYTFDEFDCRFADLRERKKSTLRNTLGAGLLAGGVDAHMREEERLFDNAQEFVQDVTQHPQMSHLYNNVASSEYYTGGMTTGNVVAWGTQRVLKQCLMRSSHETGVAMLAKDRVTGTYACVDVAHHFPVPVAAPTTKVGFHQPVKNGKKSYATPEFAGHKAAVATPDAIPGTRRDVVASMTAPARKPEDLATMYNEHVYLATGRPAFTAPEMVELADKLNLLKTEYDGNASLTDAVTSRDDNRRRYAGHMLGT